jgi:hypothetical protein
MYATAPNPVRLIFDASNRQGIAHKGELAPGTRRRTRMARLHPWRRCLFQHQGEEAAGDMERLGLHHLYRAMGWLGEELADDQQADPTPFAPRCLKDVMKEELFARRRDLFSRLALVLVDTTNLYFEGAGVRLHRRASTY